MHYKKINIKNRRLISLPLKINFSSNKSNSGIIYTFYSDRLNLLEVGYAENETTLENKLFENKLILLDMKSGKEQELYLLIKTLSEFGIKFSNNSNFTYSKTIIRLLSTLGWPVGHKLYKQRRIKKELSFA